MQPLKTERPNPDAPRMPLQHLDDLWFQVTGTLCNLECNHCFNNSGPNNRTFDMMDPNSIKKYLEQSRDYAVKQYYFTGGEPFLHPDMNDILAEALELGPSTVLTNATAFNEKTLDELAELFHTSRYSLEIRVSIDGFTPETNDPIRGEGTFDRAMEGVKNLVERGLLPIITATRTWDINDDPEVLEGFRQTLQDIGYNHPRIKLLPSLKIGREQERNEGYHPTEKVTHSMMKDLENDHFICSNSRLITDRGIWACPILVLHKEAKVGDTLEQAMNPVSLGFDACYTCYQFGQLCSNMPTGEYSTESNDSSSRTGQPAESAQTL